MLNSFLELRHQYLSLSDAEDAIRKVIQAQLENAPPRLLNTTTGVLHHRDAQIHAFTMSTQYKELLSFTMKHADHMIQSFPHVEPWLRTCKNAVESWPSDDRPVDVQSCQPMY